ncbi:MAG: hypothetical protein ACOX1P_22610 [Thermoguttaceae bacterium]
MDRCDIVLLIVAAFVATWGLVRLMNHRRNQLLDETGGRVDQGDARHPTTSSGEPEERRDA